MEREYGKVEAAGVDDAAVDVEDRVVETAGVDEAAVAVEDSAGETTGVDDTGIVVDVELQDAITIVSIAIRTIFVTLPTKRILFPFMVILLIYVCEN